MLFEEPSFVGRDDESLRLREEFARRHPELFTFPAALPQQRGNRAEFNHFKPDSILQYVKMPMPTVGQLIAVASVITGEIAMLRERS